MTKLLIATPAYGQIFYSPYVESIIKLTHLIHRNRWDFVFRSISYAEISESRNYLLTHWIDKSDASHVLFIDADMGFEPQLIADMIAFDKPVVGVVYPKRNINLHRIATLAGAGEPSGLAITKAHEFVFRPLRRGGRSNVVNGFMEVERCGAGILLIQRSCVEMMLRRIPELNDEKAKKRAPSRKISIVLFERSIFCIQMAIAYRKTIRSAVAGETSAMVKSGSASDIRLPMSGCKNSRAVTPTS